MQVKSCLLSQRGWPDTFKKVAGKSSPVPFTLLNQHLNVMEYLNSHIPL